MNEQEMTEAITKAIEEALATTATRSEGAYLAVFVLLVAVLLILCGMWVISKLIKELPKIQTMFHDQLEKERTNDRDERDKDRKLFQETLDKVVDDYKQRITEVNAAHQAHFQMVLEQMRAESESFIACVDRNFDKSS